MARRKDTSGSKTHDPRVVPGRFNIDTFQSILKDLKSKRVPLRKVTVSDDMESGLRAIIRDTGVISYHFNFKGDDVRAYLKLGEHPELTLNEARSLARTIRALSARGIDPTKGLHDRLMRELLDKGDKWRP